MSEKAVILIDGGFLKVKLQRKNKAPPEAKQITEFCKRIMEKPILSGINLLRIYYYDAAPLSETIEHPVDKSKTNLAITNTFRQGQALISGLELETDVAVRLGRLHHQGWVVSTGRLLGTNGNPNPDLKSLIKPNICQKGVDMRIGLDIAWIALKKIAQHLILVTGDSDFIPAMKFARREGMRVYLETTGHGVYRELKVHADVIF
jgi:uncharacterized LabA/DUF88 family protein